MKILGGKRTGGHKKKRNPAGETGANGAPKTPKSLHQHVVSNLALSPAIHHTFLPFHQ
jgi:hypothetical protein